MEMGNIEFRDFSLPKETNDNFEIFSSEDFSLEDFPGKANNNPIVFFNDFLKKIDGVSIRIGDVPKNASSKKFYLERKEDEDKLSIVVSENFSYIDLPSLILEIRDNSDAKAEIAEVLKLIAEKYKIEALHLIGVLKSDDWTTNPSLNPHQKNFTRKVRKKMSNQAFAYFQFFRAFSGEDISKDKESSKAFEDFCSKISTESKSKRVSETSRKLRMLRVGISKETGYFETEFLEVLALDDDGIDCLEEEEIVNLLRKEIEKNFSFHEKFLLTREIENWEKEKEESKSEYEKTKSLKQLMKRLDSIYKKLKYISFFKDAEKELEISETMFGKEIQNSLKKGLESSIVERGIKNVQEKSTLKKIFKSKFYFYYKKVSPEKAESLQKTIERYKSLKGRCKSNPNDEDAKEKLSKLQESIGNVFLEIIFSSSEEFLKFASGSDEHSYELSSISKEKSFYSVNCMLIGSILYAMWEDFFDEKLIAVASNEHFSMAIKNPKGEIISFDEIVKKTDLKYTENIQYPKNYRKEEGFAMIGDFETMYSAAVLNTMGMLELKNRNFERAEFAVKRAIERTPKNPNYWSQLSEIYKKWGNSLKNVNPEESKKLKDKMENCLKKAISLDKMSFSYLVNLGNYYMEEGKLEAAEKTLRKAHKINIEEPHVLSSLGYFCFLKGSYDEALGYFRESVHRDPASQTGYYSQKQIVKILELKGETKKALIAKNAVEIIKNILEA